MKISDHEDMPEFELRKHSLCGRGFLHDWSISACVAPV
jgi:hypothetical protein